MLRTQAKQSQAQPSQPRSRRGLRTPLAVAAGAALGYLLDPQLGRGRRARLSDQVAAKVRRSRRAATQPIEAKATVARDKAVGRARQAVTSTGPETDQALADKVRSEVLGDEEYRDATINVMAVDGTVTLHGQLKRPDQIRDLRERVAKLKGVRRVESFLHQPGTPPPNKADVIEASEEALRRVAEDAVQHTPD